MCDSSIPVPEFDLDELDEFDYLTSFPKFEFKSNLYDLFRIFGFELMNRSPIKASTNSCVYLATSFVIDSKENPNISNQYALKISTNKTRLFNEFENYNKFPNTQYLVHCYDLFELDDFLILQMELCDGGDIYGMAFDEKTTWKLIHDISNALNTIHSEGLLHLDISPSNILINHSNFKLSDFGNVIESGSFKPGDEGAGPYVAPEILQFPGKKETGFVHVWSAADIFSFGVVLLECTTGIFAPRGGTLLYEELRKGKVKLGENNYKCNCTNQLKSLVNKMIDPDPMLRPTAYEIMNHPFVNRYGC